MIIQVAILVRDGVSLSNVSQGNLDGTPGMQRHELVRQLCHRHCIRAWSKTAGETTRARPKNQILPSPACSDTFASVDGVAPCWRPGIARWRQKHSPGRGCQWQRRVRLRDGWSRSSKCTRRRPGTPNKNPMTLWWVQNVNKQAWSDRITTDQ